MVVIDDRLKNNNRKMFKKRVRRNNGVDRGKTKIIIIYDEYKENGVVYICRRSASSLTRVQFPDIKLLVTQLTRNAQYLILAASLTISTLQLV